MKKLLIIMLVSILFIISLSGTYGLASVELPGDPDEVIIKAFAHVELPGDPDGISVAHVELPGEPDEFVSSKDLAHVELPGEPDEIIIKVELA